ncbi:hypothetical protein ABKN59_003059 [Abortiporus biennis]
MLEPDVMSSNSMFNALEGQQRNEYPFPIVDTVEPPSSSSDSTPSRTKSTHTKSYRSSRNSRQHRSTERGERDYDHLSGSSAKILSRIISRDDRDIKHVRALLVLTTDRLEGETKRADLAEQRVIDTLRRLREANEATALARSEAARAQEELSLYKLQLEHAQREINRAQEILNQVEQERAEAEAEAARSRSTARRFREERLVSSAREQGRQEGYKEGYSRGKNMGFYQAHTTTRSDDRNFMLQRLQADEESLSYDDDDLPQPEEIRPRTPLSPPARRLQPRPALVPQPQTNPSVSEGLRDSHVSDSAPFAPTLPVPTITTPGDIKPIPIHNAVPSPVHPHVDIPPDNYIPYADPDSGMIDLPPPHELSRPVSPRSPSPPHIDHQLPPASMSTYQPSVRSRDFAVRNNPSDRTSSGHIGHIGSPMSRTSTRISQYDIVAPPGRTSDRAAAPPQTYQNFRYSNNVSPAPVNDPERTRTPVSGPSRERELRSPRGPRDRTAQESSSSGTSSTGSDERRPRENSGRSPLERLFKKRYRNRASPPDYPPSPHVPDIIVESPSTQANSNPSSGQTSAVPPHPNLLSPDYANRPLPIPAPEPIVVMHYEAPQDPPEFKENPLPIPPRFDPISNGFPAGFMPTNFTPSPQMHHQSLDRKSTPSPFREASASRSSSPYPVAPIPSNVVYPDPPGRPSTPRNKDNEIARFTPPSSPSSPRRRRGSLAGRLSPLSLGRSFSFFSSPSED